MPYFIPGLYEMIRLLNHKELKIATEIREVFQESYAVEAKLLGAENNFPPLKRPISGFTSSDSEFYGFFDSDSLAAVIEIKNDSFATHIQSLVVLPSYFRKGIAGKLLTFLFENYDSQLFTVETGAENAPAIALYERFGFQKTKQWMTDIGIEKVAFKKAH